MSPNATAADLAATHKMDPEENNQPGPTTGSAIATPSAASSAAAAAAAQCLSPGDYSVLEEAEKAKEVHRLHSLIQEQRRAQLEETKRLKEQDRAEKEEKERLEKAKAAQEVKDKEQKARIERAIQATPEERAAYETAMNNVEDRRNRERYRANTMASINGYLKRQGIKRR
ncbi:hypothetical protein CABS01_13859 [Colletotrichum abscissum]|uniref:Uncharacterized protein n=1 Tax=Colletotrichum abscissum TaxID=1671311 RepID=A0A9P9XS90_9PEZI|nr:uncharacterized protein CABS01_13859 [Colletotrichum abscissum]KAI3558756.1 hypothetical protein CABS02_00796 [Colletotrichum abscissum]KAK1484436.1 hypothetical protein CABS01_13859 [Colletotrichum abscissum]